MIRKSGLFWIMALMLISFSGCKVQNPEPGNSHEKRSELVYYTIGSADKDLDRVNKSLNKLLIEKIGVTIKYEKIPFKDYERHLNQLINSGGNYDIIFAHNNYVTNALRGAWLPLDEYLATVGRDMFDVIDPIFWEGVRINEKIYGVPTNKELAVLEHWMYPAELVEKYGIDISRYKKLEDLYGLFAQISKNEPEYLIMELDRDSHNFFALNGYEYITDRTLPLMVQSLSDIPQVVNIFETEYAGHILNTLRRYYQAGYINQDAGTSAGGELSNKPVFFRQARGGPYSAEIWSKQRGYNVVAAVVSDAVITNDSIYGGIMTVSASTKYPEECVRFLNCLNTDPEVRNLINYGIEGVHYSLSDRGQVIKNSPVIYEGVQYTQGNWFILNTLQGEPPDKWEQYKAFNATAMKSNLLGFIPDLSGYSQQIEAIKLICEKYYPSLMTGSVNVNIYLPKFIQELKSAGIDSVRIEIQRQIDQWEKKTN